MDGPYAEGFWFFYLFVCALLCKVMTEVRNIRLGWCSDAEVVNFN